MTASIVTQTNLYAGASSQAEQVKNSQSDDFSKIFAAQSSQTKADAKGKSDAEAKEPEKTERLAENAERIAKDTKTDKASDNKPVEEKKKVSDVKEEQTLQPEDEDAADTEAVMEAVSQLMAAIQSILGISDEKLRGAMEELGISEQDLLNTEIIPKLVVALTEGADELSVMTNEELFSDVQAIGAKAEDLLKDLSEQTNLSPETLKEMLQNMSEAEETVVTDEVQTKLTENTTEVPVTEETGVQEAVMRPEASKSTEDNKQKSGNEAERQMTFAQSVMNQIEQAVIKTEAARPAFSTTESIMNQIQDVIKIIRTEDATEMELQLHPASLGYVRVSLTAREGVITATFTAESETVRAALESQMVTLKQSFEEQGIKVEAVEVTVASHAFERNLNGDENGANEQPTSEKRKNTRKITLSDLMNGMEETEISDEDRIVAEMMKQNGNTVDYTV